MIAILGVTLLLGAFATGRLALLQGLRRIEDMARVNVLGTLLGSVVVVAICRPRRGGRGAGAGGDRGDQCVRVLLVFATHSDQRGGFDSGSRHSTD